MRLLGYWRSGTSHRVRIALALKGVAFETEPVNLAAGAHREAAFRATNPQGLAPALILDDGRVLTQSPAILEWLEETYPDPPLLPADAYSRARVRAMAAIVACDVHPLGNMRVLKALRDDYGQDDVGVAAWAMRWIGEGFAALEALMADQPGPWAYGGAPSLADCAIVPQIYAAASRYQADLAPFPRLAALAAAADAHPAFLAAHPQAQPDRPG